MAPHKVHHVQHGLAAALGGPLERALFAGDIMAWLDERAADEAFEAAEAAATAETTPPDA